MTPHTDRWSLRARRCHNVARSVSSLRLQPHGPNRRLSPPEGDRPTHLIWNLSFGYLTNPPDQSNRYNPEFTLYFDPNGGQHSFYETLHEGEGGIRSDYGYTRDATYLRLRVNPANEPPGTRYLEHPDGTIHIFDPQGRIREIRNQFSNLTIVQGLLQSTDNYIKFAYATSIERWTITDSRSRTHTVEFEQPGIVNVIRRVNLQNPDERPDAPAQATYHFSYDTPHTIRQPFPANDEKFPDQDVDLLIDIQQPDGTHWTPGGYILDAKHLTADPPPYDLNGKNLSSGFLTSLTTPLGATMRWEYTVYRYRTHVNMPLYFVSGGVGKKTVEGSSLPGDIIWKYEPKFVPPNEDPRDKEFYNVVTDPLKHQTKHYFNIAGPVEEFGLPYTPEESIVVERRTKYLSQEVSQKLPDPSTAVVKVRSQYVSFEWEAGELGDRNRNRLMRDERTTFHDDPEAPPGGPGGPNGPDRVIDIDRDSPDKRGHYRQEVVSGFSGIRRTTRTEYDGDTPAASSPWVLNTFTETKRTEAGQSFRELYCFNSKGFLQRKRTIKDTSLAANPGDRDLIRVFLADAEGFVGFEQLYGGDLHLVPTTTGCSDNLSDMERQIQHLYQRGVRRYSKFIGSNFAQLNLKIGVAGLPIKSFDASGVETNYDYDSMGRLSIMRAGDDAPLHVSYNPDARPARVVYQHFKGHDSSVEMDEVKILFDGLGRPFRTFRQRDGNGAYDETRTSYDGVGNVIFRSEQAREGDSVDGFGTNYRFFDPFGRPGEVETADGSKTKYAYRGIRLTTRTVKIGTSQDAQGNVTQQDAMTAEFYDHFGRLSQVLEPVGAIPLYTYDGMDHLVKVEMPDQTREFGYDGRGFLRWENHPEKRNNDFTPWDAWSSYPTTSHVDYVDYNTLGQPGLRVDGSNYVRFKYDAAGRSSDVFLERDAFTPPGPGYGQTRPLKHFDYGDSTLTANANLGKVTVARRWNYPRIGSTVFSYAYRYDYFYGGRSGRISKRDTTATFNGVTGQESPAADSFTQGWTWDEMGRPLSVSYPQCTFTPCSSVQTSSFIDVPTNHPNLGDIEAIYGAGLTVGCGAGNYCPNQRLTRAETAVFLLRGDQGSTYQPPACVNIFTDVACGTHWAASYIYDMWQRGITAGCSTTPARFCPEEPVKRAQMAVFLLRIRHGRNYVAPNCSSTDYTDVVCGVDLGNWVEQARVEQLMEGRSTPGPDLCGGANKFCPNSDINRAEMASILRKGFNLALPPNSASPRVVRNVYREGFLTEVSPFAGIDYHPNGLVKNVRMSNGDTWTQTIAPHRMPRPATIGVNFGPPTPFTYSYDGVGNVIKIQLGTESNKYLYDGASRLLRETRTDGFFQQYTYDDYGNIQSIASNTSNPTYGRQTPTSVLTNRLDNAAYDASGNMTSWSATAYAYDALNMLSRVNGLGGGGEDWHSVYDADDERIVSIRVSPDGSLFYRFTLRDLDGKVLRTYETTNAWAWGKPINDHIYRGNQLLADVWMANGQGAKWLFPDHLGTPRIIRRASDQSAVSHHYFAFGEEYSPSDDERMKFTGHERDGLTTASTADDLDYMHARVYNPLFGRFTSTDPIGGRPSIPQSWNRYSYASNNPLRYVDPTGKSPSSGRSDANAMSIQELRAEQFALRAILKATGSHMKGEGADLARNRTQQMDVLGTGAAVVEGTLGGAAVGGPMGALSAGLGAIGGAIASERQSGQATLGAAAGALTAMSMTKLPGPLEGLVGLLAGYAVGSQQATKSTPNSLEERLAAIETEIKRLEQLDADLARLEAERAAAKDPG